MGRIIRPPNRKILSGFPRAQLSHPQLKGCELWYPMQEPGGGTVFEVIKGRHGTIAGTLSVRRQGPWGQAARFDGSTNYIDISQGWAVADIGAPFTVSAWVALDDITHNSYSVVGASGAGSSASTYFIFLHRNDQSGMCMQWDDGPTSTTFAAPARNITALDWHHVVLVNYGKDLDWVTIWQDAECIRDAAFAMAPGGTTTGLNWQIGAFYTTSNPMAGSIADVRIYSRALNPGEIQALFENPWAPFERRSWIKPAAGPSIMTVSVTDGISMEGIVLAGSIQHSSTSDNVGWTDTTTPHLIARIYEAITLAANLSTKLTAHAAVTETLTLDAVLTAVWQMLLQDGLALTDTSSALLKRSAAIAESLVLSGVLSSTLTAHALVAEVLALRDLVSPAFGASITETLSFADAVTARATYYKQILDTLTVSDVAKNSLRAVCLVQDGVTFADTASAHGIFYALIQDGVSFLAVVRINGVVYDCWVMNTENKAVTQYDGFNFSSMCEFAGMYLGAMEDGLYLMEGTTDAGQFIQARLRTGPQPIAGGQKAVVEEMFIGFRADGRMVLKVIDNEEREIAYNVRAPSDTSIKESRVKFGHGVQAQYHDFVLENVEGGYFELDHLVYTPVVLQRRI